MFFKWYRYQGVQVLELLPKYQQFFETGTLPGNLLLPNTGLHLQLFKAQLGQLLRLISVDTVWEITWQHMRAKDPDDPRRRYQTREEGIKMGESFALIILVTFKY